MEPLGVHDFGVTVATDDLIPRKEDTNIGKMSQQQHQKCEPDCIEASQ